MLEPKVFYRQLDALLSNIGSEKNTQNFLFSLLTELATGFGNVQYLTKGRLYEERGEEFVLIHSSDPGAAAKLPVESGAVQAVLTMGVTFLTI